MDEKEKVLDFIDDVEEVIEDVDEIVDAAEDVGEKAGGLLNRIINGIIRFIKYIKNLFRKD